MLPTLRHREEGPLRRSRLDRLFNEALADWFGSGMAETLSREAWMPAVDIREEAEALTLLVDLPGLERDDVEVTLDQNVLTIRGERRSEAEEKGETYHRIERRYGTFSRSFTLPRGVDAAAADAKFDNGVLTLRFPKSEAAKPQRISID